MTLLDSILQQVFPQPKRKPGIRKPGIRQPHYRAKELKGELRAIDLPASVTDQLERLFKHLPTTSETRVLGGDRIKESRRG